ncbi:MAG: LTA synthase family protein, partial [Ruminococcus sp.]|nr:LTA synthase family protein [Ruminococcus sp.]
MTDLIKTKFHILLEKVRKYNEKREENSEKFKTLNTFLLLIFPVFIVCMAEINQFKFVSSFIEFAADRPSVIVFNFIAAALVFSLLLAIFRKGWIAVTIHSFTYMALSITELFKYGTNGNHLILSDMKLFKSVKSLKSFAYIKITPNLLIYCLIVIAFLVLVFHFNPKLPKHKGVKRAVTAAVCSVVSICMIVFPSFYTPVYNFFKLDTTAANNAFLLNEKFNNNSFLAFLVETASESFENRIVEPVNYTEEYIEEIIDEELLPVDNFNNGLKPNVIVVMSESY